jgi:hypothetical protein
MDPGLAGAKDYTTGINVTTIVVATIGAVVAVVAYIALRGRGPNETRADLGFLLQRYDTRRDQKSRRVNSACSRGAMSRSDVISPVSVAIDRA